MKKEQSTLLLTTGRFFSALFLCAAISSVFTPTAFTEEEKKEPLKRELYRWKDDQGIFHVTDDAGKIPKKYRSRTERIESPQGTEPEPASGKGGGGAGAPRTQNDQAEDLQELQRGVWRERLKEWRGKLANAELRFHELELKRDAALTRWGGPAVSGRTESSVEAQQIELQMKQVQAEIDEARSQIEVVIPEEARKAGVPPGWLRE